MVFINVRAKATQITDDVVALQVDCPEMTMEEQALLEKMFPNTGAGVTRLLNTEALIASLISNVEADMAEKTFKKALLGKSGAPVDGKYAAVKQKA